MKKMFVVVTAVGLGLGSLAAAEDASAYLLDWNGGPGISVVSTENTSATLNNARDITKAWHATDGVNHYFRLDLAQAPSVTATVAGIYGIYINSIDGQGSTYGYEYVPSGETGIDSILDSHYSKDMGAGTADYTQHDFHQWNSVPGFMQKVGVPVNQHIENGGKTLEWQIAVAAVGEDFTWLGATHDYISGVVQLTWDKTALMTAAPAPAPVPLPTSVLLLGSGVLGMLGVRRKKG